MSGIEQGMLMAALMLLLLLALRMHIAMAMPPRQWPIMALPALNSALDRPPWVANCPISRNSGTTDKSYTE